MGVIRLMYGYAEVPISGYTVGNGASEGVYLILKMEEELATVQIV